MAEKKSSPATLLRLAERLFPYDIGAAIHAEPNRTVSAVHNL